MGKIPLSTLFGWMEESVSCFSFGLLAERKNKQTSQHKPLFTVVQLQHNVFFGAFTVYAFPLTSMGQKLPYCEWGLGGHWLFDVQC